MILDCFVWKKEMGVKKKSSKQQLGGDQVAPIARGAENPLERRDDK